MARLGKANASEQYNEAVVRLQSLNLHPNVLKDFEEGVINVSENPYGFLYWAKEDIIQAIKEFEEEYTSIVYHVSYTNTEFGELYAFFYVSQHKEEWEMDREDLKEGCPIVYVYNKDDEFCSELGSIGFKVVNGGVVRTA
jgi:hypothetical protein